jgi:hypothetical protein
VSSSLQREQAMAVVRVHEFMRARHLSLSDLAAYGGEDLPNPKLPERIRRPARLKKARAVEATWALMAQLGLTFAALEAPSNTPSSYAPVPLPENKSRTQRGGRALPKHQRSQQLTQSEVKNENPAKSIA